MLDPQPGRLDEALDSALASYGAAPERAGLEQRILARVSDRTSQTRSQGLFALALGAAALAACCVFWWISPKPAAQTHPASAAIHAPVLERGVVVANAAAPDTPKLRRARRLLAEPKLAQFPAPSPITGEERALLRLAAHDAKAIPRELTHFGQPIEAIEVKAIEVEPLSNMVGLEER